MILYLLQTSIGFILFYALYQLLLAKLTFYQLNRLFLLGSLGFSLIFPWLTIYMDKLIHMQTPNMWYEYLANEVVVHAGKITTSPIADDTPWYTFVLPGLYILGICIVLLRLLFGLFRVYYLYQSGSKYTLGRFTIIETKKDHLPFSFFHCIFLKTYVKDDATVQTIIKHETVHASQWHSIDVILLECLQVMYWFLPVIPLYKRAVRQVHECLADQGVCRVKDRDSYIRDLLQEQNIAFQVRLGNPFFQSQIKQRLHMMTKKKSQGYTRLMYVLFLPVAAGLLLCFGLKPLKANQVLTSPTQVTIPDTVPKPPKPPVPPKAPNTPQPAKAPQAPATSGKGSNAPLPPPAPPVPNPSATPSKKDDIFRKVDVMPRFYHPDCESLGDKNAQEDCSRGKLMEYIGNNLVYPESAKKDSIQGMVVAQFIIDKEGKMIDFLIVRDIGHHCGDAVKDLFTNMIGHKGFWIPGMDNGENVNVHYTFPVRFKLN